MLIAHIAVSVAWLGVSLCLLVLAATARVGDSATAALDYRAMETLAGTLLPPVSLLALATGVVLAAGPPWGLTRHYWILTKLVLTLAAAIGSVFALPALIAEEFPPEVAGDTGNNLIIASAVSVATYTAIVALSVLKPWGRIPHGGPNGPRRAHPQTRSRT